MRLSWLFRARLKRLKHSVSERMIGSANPYFVGKADNFVMF